MDEQTAPAVEPKVCKHGRPITEAGPLKDCKVCYNTANQQKLRKKKADKLEEKAALLKSPVVLDEDDAKDVLRTRIVNPHVVDTCYDLGLVAAKHHELIPNHYFWINGLQKTLDSIKSGKPKLLEVNKQEVDGEVIHYGDLFAIFDFSVSWREETDFEQYLALRRTLKTDWYALGKFIGIPFEPLPHRQWADFLPQWVPGLRPGYNLQDMREWLSKQKSPTYPVTTRDFLLQASRNTMKSTASLALATAFVLCCPSARLLLVSETTKLSKDLIKAFRGIWENGNNPAYERFQYFFPEFCIEPGEGTKNEFTSPMRSFVLPQETAEVASLEVSVAGRRADLQLYDDVVSDKNTANDDQRIKGINTYYALTKLREAGAGIAITIGTPWFSPGSGETGDLYHELMRINDSDPEHPMAVLVQPAMILHPHAQRKIPDHVLEIVESDVHQLTCPSRWTFKDLMKEARKNVRMFLTQNLCMYVESDESKIKVQFDEQVLRAHVRLPRFFDNPKYRLIETIMAVDIAYSTSRHADFSAIAVGKVYQDPEHERHILVIVKMVMERLRPSELADKIMDVRGEFNPSKIVIERSGSWQNLSTELDNNCRRRGIGKLYNIFWKPTNGVTVKSKVERVKALETLFNGDQFWLTHSTWTESLILQFIRFDGIKRSGSSDNSKDDGPDACSLVAEASHYLRVFGQEVSEAQREMERELETQRYLQAQYERLFGSNIQQRDPVLPFTPQPPDELGPLYSQLDRFGLIRKVS